VSLSRTSPEGITYSGSYSFGANTTGNDITYVATIAAADIKNLTGSYATETFQVLQSGAGCGDSTVQAGSGETCDAGAGNTNTACTAAYGQTCNYCDTSCVSHDVVGTRCGDNTVQAGNGEICDDGNTANGDGCSSACQTEDLTPSQAISITLGDDFSCVLFSNGKVACTGSNSSGQLGNGTTRKSLGIAYVSGITSAEQISSGEQATHTCARLSSGAVKCWGANYAGQLGNGTTTNSSTPVSMSGISNAIDVSVGGTNTCVVLQDGTIRCAGTGYTGVATIPDISNAIQVSVMTTSTCALLSGHTVKCWGENSNGTLGNGSTTSSNTPVGVTGISNAVKLMHGGYSHMCALLDDTTAKCWGYNHTSQVGDGTQTNRTTPVVFDAGLSGIVDIAGGQDATCVILSTGQLKCVGYIQEGLGDGTSAYSGTIVTTLVSNAKNAAMSSLKTACAVRNDGTVACWGINNGVFGDLSTNFTSSATPVEMILSDTCGNGIIFPLTEQCDMSAANGTNGLCSATCQSLGGCGNGYIDSGETCDDGNQIDTDSCPNTCIATGCAANTDFDACFNDHVNMCMWMGGSCQAW
jgi:cysteine-rich repeat protein